MEKLNNNFGQWQAKAPTRFLVQGVKGEGIRGSSVPKNKNNAKKKNQHTYFKLKWGKKRKGELDHRNSQ